MSAIEVSVYRKKRVVFAYLAYRYLQSADRRFWVHPLVSSRLLKGAFASLYVDLSNDETTFFNYFRMSKRSFDELAGRIGDSIRSQDTNFVSLISLNFFTDSISNSVRNCRSFFP
jgi:hypothetical protein